MKEEEPVLKCFLYNGLEALAVGLRGGAEKSGVDELVGARRRGSAESEFRDAAGLKLGASAQVERTGTMAWCAC